ncbi:protein of unknown function [Taphrina deformans PYCC 5710]|uniref:Prenylcysteine lyase domain-containing protein n=1 Tax=Taphrina deformans (strain PYCC 5710 / ATCC 11124 / CBS 356.35 / IMI 108563 / JCM 9778 / NBRC 8474) TaxID=1097556 RepID=R4XDS7_TAPDE|nr:protein of unknown function [Taphrina deformans PYCC 5710]|eukprot:CCG83985.1 protein of unknown function [Taphrina deformans PYCC 5710]
MNQLPLSSAYSGRDVAIIGAGPGGSAAAYYLSQQSPDLALTIYERNDYIGGRCTTIEVLGETIELGASIFVDVNSNLVTAAKQFNLSYTSDDKDGTDSLGVWNGEDFVYRDMGGSKYWNLAKLVWKYGLSPYRAQQHVAKVLGQFEGLYDAIPFPQLTKTAEDLDLLQYTNVSGLQSYQNSRVSEVFLNHIVNAASRVNYAQDLDTLHGLMSAVSFVTDDARAIQGGNRRIFENMVTASAATLRLNTSVSSITKLHTGWRVCDENLSCDAFRDVIIAAPLKYSDIVVTPAIKVLPVEYVTLHVTILATNQSLSDTDYFSDQSIPESILTTRAWHAKQLPFQSISIVGRAKDGSLIYKIFSMTELADADIDVLFGAPASRDWVYRKTWHSYPVGQISAEFDDWEVGDGLWYLNGMERFISTMETATLAGRNVAALISERLRNGT